MPSSYGKRLAEIGAVPSTGTVGDSFDCALIERDEPPLSVGCEEPFTFPSAPTEVVLDGTAAECDHGAVVIAATPRATTPKTPR